MPKFKEPKYGNFQEWQKSVEKKGKMTLEIFDNIFKHYRTLHDKDKALKYTIETAGKVVVAAGVEKTFKDTYVEFEYENQKVQIPSFMLDSFINKAKKDGVISIEIHENLKKFLDKYSTLTEVMGSSSSDKFLFKIDMFIAEKAGIEVDPASPVTFRSKLVFEEDKVVFFSEKYGSQEMSYNLYYLWYNSILSKGFVDSKIHSQMSKYAKEGKAEEPSQATIAFYSGFLKFMGSKLKSENGITKKIKSEYPSYFVDEMEKLIKKEIAKVAKIEIEVPEKPGSVAKINDPGRIMIKLAGWDALVGLEPALYHSIYSETVENKGKAPSWTRYRIYKFLYDEGHGYPSDDAMTVAKLLVSFFQYQVAKDAQAAKNIVEQEKKLKGIPKK